MSSIYNAIRSTRVAPDIGEFAESFRIQGDAIFCPVPQPLDMYGRPASFNTINQQPHGYACQNQVAWIERENFQRPIFSEFINDKDLQGGIECGGDEACMKNLKNPLPPLFGQGGGNGQIDEAPFVYSQEYDTQKHFWADFGQQQMGGKQW